MLLTPISQSKYPYIREHLIFPPKIAHLEHTKLTKCHFLSHGEQLRFSEMLVSQMIVSLKRWIRNDMFLRSPFLVMLSPYLRLCERVCVGRRSIRMYACIWIYVSGSLGSWRPVLCNTPQPNQLKFDFNLCVTFLFGSACVCVCQHVGAWSFVQRHVYIPQAVKDWRRCSLSFSLSFYISFFFFLPFLAFLCLCGWTALSHIHRLPTPAVMMVTDREFTARKGEKDG